MDERPIVRFQNVSKKFNFSVEKQQTVLNSMISIFSREQSREKTLWAVHDVSFDVMPGQCLGIIGRNGSGKSTILKLIARILRPNEGQIMVRGRVSALLELGAGFHPDLTGRENIFLNASVLGLSQQDIERYYQSIVTFSELDEFIDMPVKHYSSGMYMRLGFSVAIHVLPDILIVDEILSVGDQAFQTKCNDRIYDMKRRGTTIIIVSHDLNKLRKICSHMIWIEKGHVQAQGVAEEVAEQYQAYSVSQTSHQVSSRQNGSFARWGNGKLEITGVRFLNAEGQEQAAYRTGDQMTIEIAYQAHEPIEEPEFGLAIFHQDGTHINGPNNQLAGLKMGTVSGCGVVRYQIDPLPLLPAGYLVTAAVHDSHLSHAYDFHQQAYSFRVVAGGTEEVYGLVALPATWTWEPALNNHPE